ncbi:MAG: ParA family protein [Archaeoglobaceae archaeon]|nr:ParA family protein [Archaeoglobaceae archaeon]MCX8000226.1 ParA family protein [Leptospiraceae bacterium]MDW7990210.1 ParA family protein [Archaeoglobaceae archaeon]
MIRIAICNQKGGVGKTTTAVNLSVYLAISGKRTLLIDLDPQCAATSGMGIDGDKTSYNLMSGDNVKPIESSIKNLFIIPASIDLAGAEIELASEPNRDFVLKESLKKINRYEYTIVDTPPNLGILTINAMTACERVLVPVQAEYYSMEALSRLWRVFDLLKKRLKVDIKDKYVITMFDSRLKICREVEMELRKNLGDRVLKTIIPRNARLAEAPSYGKPIALYDPKCRGAKAYKLLSEEVISLEGRW